MARQCTICTHPQRHDIDRAIVNGITYREIASTFGLSESSVGRHRLVHLPRQLTKAVAAQQQRARVRAVRAQEARDAEETRQAIDIVQQLKAINSACLEVLRTARESKQHSLLLRSVDRIHRQIDLQARLLGEIEEGPTVNVLIAPEWQEVRQSIFVALAAHPEARADVARKLAEFEDVEE
jgi:DNA-binding transcriptional ArsR family regulator